MMKEVFIGSKGAQIAYTYIPGTSPLTYVYLHGLRSSRSTEKGRLVAEFAQKNKCSFLSLDYTAHGESSGKPADFRVGRCLRDARDAIQTLLPPDAPLIFVGSSLGGWIALLLAEEFSERVRGLLGIAAAPDFLDEIWHTLFSTRIRLLLRAGAVLGPNPQTRGYCFSYKMFREARRYNLLKRRIMYQGPVILMQGDKDKLAKWPKPLYIKDALLSEDVQILLVKGADHHLSRAADLELMWNQLSLLLKKGEKHD